MIYLVRHGQTVFNAEGRFQGHNDSPLTELGRAQARGAGRLLSDLRRGEPGWRLVSSPLGRARETAGIIAGAAGVQTIEEDARLMEITLGEWDGLTRAEIDARSGMQNGHALNWWFNAPGGETYPGFSGRLQAWLDDAARSDGVIVAVSHGGTSRQLRGAYLGLKPSATFELDVPQDAMFRLWSGQVDRLEFPVD